MPVPTGVVCVGLCWVSEAVGPIAAEASHLDSIRAHSAQSDTAISAISAANSYFAIEFIGPYFLGITEFRFCQINIKAYFQHFQGYQIVPRHHV